MGGWRCVRWRGGRRERGSERAFFFYSLSFFLPAMPAPPPHAAPSASAAPGGGALGEALIPTINRLHDIFSTVREREGKSERAKETSLCARRRARRMRPGLRPEWPPTTLGGRPCLARQPPLDKRVLNWLCSVGRVGIWRCLGRARARSCGEEVPPPLSRARRALLSPHSRLLSPLPTSTRSTSTCGWTCPRSRSLAPRARASRACWSRW